MTDSIFTSEYLSLEHEIIDAPSPFIPVQPIYLDLPIEPQSVSDYGIYFRPLPGGFLISMQ